MSKNELLEMYKNERSQCECWTRVMGYLRNRNSFNDGKQSEWKQRVWFKESKCGLPHSCCK